MSSERACPICSISCRVNGPADKLDACPVYLTVYRAKWDRLINSIGCRVNRPGPSSRWAVRFRTYSLFRIPYHSFFLPPPIHGAGLPPVDFRLGISHNIYSVSRVPSFHTIGPPHPWIFSTSTGNRIEEYVQRFIDSEPHVA